MTFDGFLRRNFWLVPLPLLAIVAGLNAEAIGELAGLSVGVDAHQLALQHPSAVLQKTTTTPERVLSAKAILERNPFDHVTGSLLPRSGDPESSAGTEAIATSDPWSAPTCDDVDVQVIAESSEADESFADLRRRGRAGDRGELRGG